MVRRCGLQLGGQRRGPVVGKLIGVQPYPESVLAGGTEHLPGLVDGERLGVDEGVGVLGQSLLGHDGQQLIDQPDEAAKYARQGKDCVREHYSWDAVASDYLELLVE